MTVINGTEMDDGVDEPNAIERECDEPQPDDPGYKPCNCEDYPCCGH